MMKKLLLGLSCLIAASMLPGIANADPCGMVPPIYTGPGVAIERTGLQQTYVFYKDGVETFVIKPGFQGRVEDFGMLIPFPSPPSLRKVPDNVFSQLDNAIDPPEVVVDLRPRPELMRMSALQGQADGAMQFANEDASKVVVLKQEAVGMYEVAVLAAGGAAGLKKWMDDNGYQYPKGMDEVCESYIQENWCFVAVKTKVGQKEGADPKAGQRAVETQRPANSVFDGNVQGMGFRFKSEKLVVPMRLSAFNDGDLRNIVYLLADSPKRIRNIPEEYVVRQVSGDQLLKNVTQPLPMRVLGGTVADIPEHRRKSLKKERDPRSKNGAAKNLFASDLLAVSSGELSLEIEEAEKDLLRINEHFGLRGPAIDGVLESAQQQTADKISEAAIADLAGMTLTLVDGDFPREVIANQNLGFANYTMPGSRNNGDIYDSKSHGKPNNLNGNQGIRIGQVDLEVWEAEQQHASRTRNRNWSLLIGCLSLGLVWNLRRVRKGK